MSRRVIAQGGSPSSGRIDIIMRSALMSGISKEDASLSFQNVDLPDPLWPARTIARGLLDNFWALTIPAMAVLSSFLANSEVTFFERSALSFAL